MCGPSRAKRVSVLARKSKDRRMDDDKGKDSQEPVGVGGGWEVDGLAGLQRIVCRISCCFHNPASAVYAFSDTGWTLNLQEAI